MMETLAGIVLTVGVTISIFLLLAGYRTFKIEDKVFKLIVDHRKDAYVMDMYLAYLTLQSNEDDLKQQLTIYLDNEGLLLDSDKTV